MDAAQILIHKQGWYSGNGEYAKRKAIKIIYEGRKDDVYLVDGDHDYPLTLDVNLADYESSLRKSTLDKLSEAERKVLGL